uniref:Uncharacterized protein n=1 Tax=Ralstonia solanacearum TaxID=305 RepID=A0A0S4VCS1_RALSL|nr:conserved protein of unknown function [Ralstonia solanacearum]
MNKEQFVAQLKQQEEQNAAGKTLQQADIETFQQRVGELASRIRGWLDGVQSVQLNVTPMTLFDETLVDKSANSSYQIDCITITANGRTLRLRPDALYLIGSKGCVEIEYGGVRAAGESRLYMQDREVPDGEWALVTTTVAAGNQKARSAQIYDENAFFVLMGPLVT